MFALVMSEDRISFQPRRKAIIEGLKRLPEMIKEVLQQDEKVANKWISSCIALVVR